MLKVPNLAPIKSKDPYVYEALTRIAAAVNHLGKSTGADPAGSLTPPPDIGSVTVTAKDGVFEVAIVDDSAKTRPINYFVEYDTSPNFPGPKVVALGPTRNARVFLGNLTLYWRGYSQYVGSNPSRPVSYGSPPIGVSGGGALAGPAPQPSQGSGTAAGTQGGSGFGRVLDRGVSRQAT
jgi:hypothetical protein